MDINQLKKYAQKGKKDAQFELGMCFLEGNDIIKDPQEAEKWFKQAASRNHPEALYKLGMIKIDHEDYELAEKFLLKAVKLHHSVAYKPLGYLYKGSYDPTYEDRKKASLMFYNYYHYDKFDGLEPLLATFHKHTFKSSKTTHVFLQEAMDYGLVKAKYHLAMMYLADSKYKDIKKGIDYMQSYYDATADINAARELYYLYAPKEKKYPHHKRKDSQVAQTYLSAVIDGNGVLDGTEFIHDQGLYIPKTTIPIDDYFEKMLTRMKTSLAIETDFAEHVTKDTFDVTIHFPLETLYDYDATLTFKERVVDIEVIEKTIEKKRTVRKGFKKTGTVKVPKTIQKKKKHKSWVDKSVPITKSAIDKQTHKYKSIYTLRDLMFEVGNRDYPFEFDQPIDQNTLRKTIEKEIKTVFDKPRKIKKLKKSFNFESMLLAKPVIDVRFTHNKKLYTQTIDLSHKQTVDDLMFPLDKRFERNLFIFNIKQNILKYVFLLTTLLAIILLPVALFKIYPDYLAGIPVIDWLYSYYIYFGVSALLGIGIGFLLTRYLYPKHISNTTYIKRYDDANMDAVRRIVKTNVLKISLVLLGVLLLIGINIFLYVL